METIAIILARAGSKGLPNKCALPLCGRPMVEYTIDHARQSRCVGPIVVTTDSPEVARVARARGVEVVDRPAELATDTATVDAAARHALETYERERDFRAGIVVLLYANVPIRPPGLIDRAVEHLLRTGCDSVRSVVRVDKQHPDWLHRLQGDRMIKFRPNDIYRRQDLEPLYYHDGAVIVVTRSSLYTPPAHDGDAHAFFGRDRRAIILQPYESVDIDTPADFELAEALLRARTGQHRPDAAGTAAEA